jgi:hypothetical protein
MISSNSDELVPSQEEANLDNFTSVADPLPTSLETIQFNADEITLPWDSDGNITAFESIGVPDSDAPHWQLQTTPFTCAVVAQRGIIEEFTGHEISEAQLVYDATAHGWLTDGGMSMGDVGNLLELYGVPCHEHTDATIEDLMSELAQGHKVIVGVDSGEIWNQDYSWEDFLHQAADHAIWVTGIDTSDLANPKVIVNDSGDPNGAGKAYDLYVFRDAWQDSGFFYVSTDEAPPDIHQIANGFDPAAGVFPELVSYLSETHGDFPDHLQENASEKQNIDRDHIPFQSSEDVLLSAGTCSHCGGNGYSTWPSSGSQERCWYCGGSGVAS